MSSSSAPSASVTSLTGLPHDIQDFLRRYPGQESLADSASSHQTPNLDFYGDRIPMRPDNVTVSQFHRSWFGTYDKLEHHHGFIQWLFPIREHGVNPHARPLTSFELARLATERDVRESVQARMRVSLDLMLDFYGLVVSREETLQVGRSANYLGRYANLLVHGHNFLRISRMLKSLSEFGLERHSVPLLLFLLLESQPRTATMSLASTTKNHDENDRGGPLASPALVRSMDRYWSWCLRDDEARQFVQAMIADVRGGKVALTEREYVAILEHRATTGKWRRVVPEAEDLNKL